MTLKKIERAGKGTILFFIFAHSPDKTEVVYGKNSEELNPIDRSHTAHGAGRI